MSAIAIFMAVLLALCPDAYEPDDAPARTVQYAMEHHTFHQPGDVDQLYIDLLAGQQAHISTSTTASDTLMRLYGPDGQEVAINDDCVYPDPSSCIHYTADAAGQYTLRINEFHDLSGCSVGYDLSVQAGWTTTVAFPVQDQYFPRYVFITPGSTVTWTGDFLAYPLVSEDGLWQTVSTGTSFTYRFASPGVYGFYAYSHGGPDGFGMSGKVFVTPAPTHLMFPLIRR